MNLIPYISSDSLLYPDFTGISAVLTKLLLKVSVHKLTENS